MSQEKSATVEVSRRIGAPAARIFEVLTDPRRHRDLDGSSHFTNETRMIQGALIDDVVTGVGDVFSMQMYFKPLGHYVIRNHVVEYEQDRRIAWEPSPGDATAANDGRFPVGVPIGQRWSFELSPNGPDATLVTEHYDCSSAAADIRAATHDGEGWIETMAATLANLAALCES
jgi:uncharacterized protein YndB with AHSA1/START domain